MPVTDVQMKVPTTAFAENRGSFRRHRPQSRPARRSSVVRAVREKRLDFPRHGFEVGKLPQIAPPSDGGYPARPLRDPGNGRSPDERRFDCQATSSRDLTLLPEAAGNRARPRYQLNLPARPYSCTGRATTRAGAPSADSMFNALNKNSTRWPAKTPCPVRCSQTRMPRLSKVRCTGQSNPGARR